MLENVKTALGITGSYQDSTLQMYIDEVNNYLVSAGMPEEKVNSVDTIGIVVRGVADLWNYGSGDGKLSSYFMQRATQLCSFFSASNPSGLMDK